MAKSYYGLVVDLLNQDVSVVKCSELYLLKSNGDAITLKPNNDKDFSKSKEYGRRTEVDGKLKMLRHFILQINGMYTAFEIELTNLLLTSPVSLSYPVQCYRVFISDFIKSEINTTAISKLDLLQLFEVYLISKRKGRLYSNLYFN